MRIDREIDFHGYTRAEMRAELNMIWGLREWHGLQRVRVIHGTGAVLGNDFRRWCEEKGIYWVPEPHNPGATIVHPAQRLNAEWHAPHRPLQHLKRKLPPSPSEKQPPADKPAAPSSGPTAPVGRPPTPSHKPATPSKTENEPARTTEPGADVGSPLKRPAPAPDLMAQEWERLGREDPAVTRRRKGNNP